MMSKFDAKMNKKIALLMDNLDILMVATKSRTPQAAIKKIQKDAELIQNVEDEFGMEFKLIQKLIAEAV